MMICRKTKCSITWFALLLLCCEHPFCFARDTLTHDAPIRDVIGSESSLVSAGGNFELGFFTSQNSGKKYVGVWYHNQSPRTVVWVANREDPVIDINGVFAIQDGQLQVLDTTGKSYWSTRIEVGTTINPLNVTAVLMDSGNLVLLSSDGGDHDQLAVKRFLWQSFQNPSDTFIPGMLMDKSLELTSWKDQDDPGMGNFTFKLDQAGGNQNQYIISKLKSIIYWKSGESRMGTFFSSDEMPPAVTYLLLNFSQSYSKKHPSKIFGSSTSPNSSYSRISTLARSEYNYTRLVIGVTGELVFWSWDEIMKYWTVIWSEPKDECSVFNACGDYGSCNQNNRPLVCKCLPGFKPQSLDKWNSGDFSGGCARELPLGRKNDTFLPLKMMKVRNPDILTNVNNETECRGNCLTSDQCQAYSYAAARNREQRGAPTYSCWTWLEDLNNLQEEANGGGDISVRVALSDSESTIRDCEPCGTSLIPYPLSTRSGCGDPVYSRFGCNGSTGQVSFVAPSGSVLPVPYRVISISPRTRRFLIKNVENCDPRNRGRIQPLDQLLPFTVIHWCNESAGKFSSEALSTGSNVIEMGWDPPLEPTCATSADCEGWPRSTCSPARNGRKTCICNANFQWNGTSLSCTQEGNIRQAQNPLIEEKSSKRMSLSLILIVVAVLTSAMFLACMVSVYVWRKKIMKRQDRVNRTQLDSERQVQELMDTSEFKEEDEKGIDVPFFDLQSILEATDNFSNANKLGQGGYGPVYKGKFLGDQEIAVKRLSRASGQGLQEFKNEVVLIAKLQHRNLVRLKGYCIKGEEKILLYEYMPNKSLDSFIFDDSKSMFLNWEMRFNIILGIARGLLYLHQDSRLRIIHRDLKTSNILLDEEMNPKISDFGLARIVGGKETGSNTNTVVGTYGYMSPEYALDGIFSVKSDVYSFGVVLLEIISGKKNTGFYQSKQNFSLINYAWGLWTENKVWDLMDKTLGESCNKNQFTKCVNVGLLCVQEDPVDRPTMSNVITMLDSEIATSPIPKQPAFLIRRGNSSTASSSSKPEPIYEITTSLVEGR